MMDQGKTKECPYCKSQVPASATICKFCTKEIGTGYLVASCLSGAGALGVLFITIPLLLMTMLGYCGASK